VTSSATVENVLKLFERVVAVLLQELKQVPDVAPCPLVQ
jgi:hypothetical protein